MKKLETLRRFEKKKEQLSDLKGGNIDFLANFVINVAPYITGAGTYTDTLSNGAVCTTTCSGDIRSTDYQQYFNGQSTCTGWK